MLSINEENDNNQCVLCLEINEDIFYDYNYENNKFIHNCECTPCIHYNCFVINYNKKGKCIICLEKIEKNTSIYEYLFQYIKITRIKYIFMVLTILSLFYSFFNIEFIVIDKNMLNENDFI